MSLPSTTRGDAPRSSSPTSSRTGRSATRRAPTRSPRSAPSIATRCTWPTRPRRSRRPGDSSTVADRQIATVAVDQVGDALAQWGVMTGDNGQGLRGGTFTIDEGDTLTVHLDGRQALRRRHGQRQRDGRSDDRQGRGRHRHHQRRRHRHCRRVVGRGRAEAMAVARGTLGGRPGQRDAARPLTRQRFARSSSLDLAHHVHRGDAGHAATAVGRRARLVEPARSACGSRRSRARVAGGRADRATARRGRCCRRSGRTRAPSRAGRSPCGARSTT